MRPRIFSLMLTAFALVIVLGIGGMALFFGIAVSSFNRERMQAPSMELMHARMEAERLGEMYRQNGSWGTVDQELAVIAGELTAGQRAVVLDQGGSVVASTHPELYLPGAPLPPIRPAPPRPPRDGGERSDAANEVIWSQTLPIRSEGRQVGTLVVLFDGNAWPMQGDGFDGGRLVRGFLGAGLGLAAVLLGLAAYFSSRLSRPLRHVTGAAQALAAGDMHVRVRQPAVRELNELAGAFNTMADALVRADQQRRQLTADVAHELRTPLAIVKGRLEGIQDGIYSADASQINGLLDEVALLERLIDDLRLLALAEAGQLPLYREPVDPAELARAAHQAFAHEAAARNIDLELVLPEPLPAMYADAQRISQVLGNLVSNALRHTPEGGRVTIAATSAPPAQIRYAVGDSGPGIAPEHLPHIFDRFYRADKARTRGSGGAGLGLAIARQIVEAHGGTIEATSVPGQGAILTFTLPLEKEG